MDGKQPESFGNEACKRALEIVSGGARHCFLAISEKAKLPRVALFSNISSISEPARPSGADPNWRDYDSLAAARTLAAVRAVAKLQVARETDAHLPQSLVIATDDDSLG
jgi:hypothetical protein